MKSYMFVHPRDGRQVLTLNVNVDRIHPVLASGAKRIVSDGLGACEDWTETVLFPKMLKIVAILSGEIFVGPEIAHKEEYYTNTVTAVNDFFLAVNAVKRWPQFLKPYVKYFSSEVKGLQRHLTVHRALITPTIKARKESRDRGEDIPDDLITWMMDKAPQVSEICVQELLPNICVVLSP
jgi:hypothetical protein